MPTARPPRQNNFQVTPQMLQLGKPLMWQSIIIGAFLTWVLWMIHSKLMPELPDPETITGILNLDAWRLKIFEAGPIPIAILLFFIAGNIHLLSIWDRMLRTIKRSRLTEQGVIGAARTGKHEQLNLEMFKLFIAKKFGYFTIRIQKLFHRWQLDQDIAAVSSLKNELLDADEESFSIAFSPVVWIEWVLPILGFLGTVVGITQAIAGIKAGVESLFANGGLTDDVYAHLVEGFKGLSLAFDTTFQGLAALIIIGFLHFVCKRTALGNLAEARSVLTDYIANWKTPGVRPVVVAVGAMKKELDIVARGLDGVRKEVSTLKTRATQLMLRAPELEWMRKALLVPRVQFARTWWPQAQKLRQDMDDQFDGDWVFASLTARGDAASGFALLARSHSSRSIKVEQRLALVDKKSRQGARILKIPDGETLRKLYPSIGHRTLARTNHGGLVSLSHDEKMTSRAVRDPNGEELSLHVHDEVYLANVGGTLSTIVLKKDAPWKVYRTSNGRYDHPLERGIDFPPELQPTMESFHGGSGTLAIIARLDGQLQLLLYNLLAAPDAEHFDVVTSTMLPDGLTPKAIVSLGKEEIVILDKSGALHYWSSVCTTPVHLKNPHWNDSEHIKIWAGSDGWIASAIGDTLRVWNVDSGGALICYEQLREGLSISGVDPQSFTVSQDGQLFVGIEKSTPKMLFTWSFPRYSGIALESDATKPSAARENDSDETPTE